MIQEKTNKQEFNSIKRLINKKIEGGKYSQLPLAHQIKTTLPYVAVPGPLHPRKHSSPPGELISKRALNTA